MGSTKDNGNQCEDQEQQKTSHVAHPDAVVEEDTVVVLVDDARVANPAVLSCGGLEPLARPAVCETLVASAAGDQSGLLLSIAFH